MIYDALAGAGLAMVVFLSLRGFNLWPIVLLAGLLYFIVRMNGGLPFQKGFTRVGRGVGAANRVTFDSIGGQKTAATELQEALDFLAHPEAVEALGIRPLKGIMLSGPPGTGKTLLAKAAATYTNSVFLSASGSEFVEMYAGVGAQRIRSLFKQAKDMAKAESKKSAIIFIDEMEVLAGYRGKHSSHLEYDQTLNQLLVEMDGLSSRDEIRTLVIGATNRIDLVDPALLRPGRFDRVVRVGLPDREGRYEILKLHTANKPLAEDVDLAAVARETFGFSGAHLESVANEAAILARRAGEKKIRQAHLREAIDKVMLGEKVTRKQTEIEKHRVAVHEAGHAIISEILRPGSVDSVTISPRSNALGYVRHSPQDDIYIQPRSEMEKDVAILVAGGVAELEVFGESSTGSADDYDKATRTARQMVMCGMSDLGIVDIELIPSDVIHRTITAITQGQIQRVRTLLIRHRKVLEEVSTKLLEEESIPGEQIRQLASLPTVRPRSRKRSVEARP
ncbi:MAG: AAA family ATPase [Bacillota bacterium]